MQHNQPIRFQLEIPDDDKQAKMQSTQGINRKLSPAEIAERFSLNEEQRLSFFIFAETFLAEVRGDKNIEQMFSFLGGAGGTGKTRVVQAIRFMAENYGKASWLATGSYTGVAAHLIRGRTLHGWLKLKPENRKRRKRRVDDMKEASSTVSAGNENIKFFIIDEVSTLGCNFLGKLAKWFMRGKSSDADLGGVHIIFVGDFNQLPPVLDTPLFQMPYSIGPAEAAAARAEAKEAKSSRKSKKSQFGISDAELGWRTWNLVVLPKAQIVILFQQMRQIDDEKYFTMLTRILNQQANDDDVKYLAARAIGPSTAHIAKSARFANSTILVPRNELRHHLNISFVKEFARAARCPIHISVAEDRPAESKHPLDLMRRETLLSLLDNDTHSLMGKLPLVPMLPVLISYNIATELGVNNGTPGTILKVVFNPDSKQSLEGDPGQEITLQAMPLYVLVHVPTAQMLEPAMPGLPLNVIPVFPQEFSFKHKTSGQYYVRKQFPLILAKAITDYKSQGQTLDTIIAHLADDEKRSRTCASIYVTLSRARRLEDVLLLAAPTKEELNRPIPEGLDDLFKVLKQRALATALKWNAHPSYAGQFPTVLTNLERSIPGKRWNVSKRRPPPKQQDADARPKSAKSGRKR